MALPELAKTWLFDVNQTCEFGSGGAGFVRRLLMSIKTSLVDRLGSRHEILSPWIVTQSSNGVDEAEEDLWTSEAALVWGNAASGAHSWIVLAQPGITTNTQICFELVDDDKVAFVWAPDGFGSGSTSSRPTSPTEVTLSPGEAQALVPQITGDYLVHAMQSTDGQCTRIVFYANNVPQGFWLLDRARNPVGNWDTPAAMLIDFQEAALSYSALQSPENPNLRGRGTDSMSLFMSCESFGLPGGAVGDRLIGPNDFDGDWPLAPIGLACLDPGQRGRHGEIFDLWFASTGANDGDTYPTDGTRQFVQFGHLVFPWDGTSHAPGSASRLS